ncbi:hypothetical protein RYA60_01580, partial [Pseudomonas syringae]|nr:hypothetical protein [Pseudomonas syringae]
FISRADSGAERLYSYRSGIIKALIINARGGIFLLFLVVILPEVNSQYSITAMRNLRGTECLPEY